MLAHMIAGCNGWIRLAGWWLGWLAWAPAVAAAAAAPGLVSNPDGRPLESFRAEGRRYMVASADGEASRIGAEILERGGNAVDAAVAVSLAVGVARPQSTGIGGGGFMLLYRADSREAEMLDFRETAPAAADRDMYIGPDGEVLGDASLVGHRAVGVPGLVAGLVEAHRRHGSLPWADLTAPAIRLAEEGFEVYPDLARRLEERRESIARNPAMARVFMPEGSVLREGERLVQSDLAETLRAIGMRGRAGFYGGPVAEALVGDMRAHGGLITQADLDGYRVETRMPVQGTYRGYRILSMPPPSSGGIHVVQILNILQGYDLSRWGRGSPEAVHRMAEAMRQAYADRAAFLGDPAFVVDMPIDRLLSADYAAEARAQIPAERARRSHAVRPLLSPAKESDSTTHFSIVDGRGNIVSSTQTINYSFGACVMVPGTGVILNDEMDDFSARPGVPNVFGLVGGEANAIEPGKRPLSSMSPTLVMREGKPWLVLGSPGGSRIITAVAQALINRIEFGLPLEEAVAAARMHHQWLPDRIEFEEGAWPRAAAEALAAMGHEVAGGRPLMGDVQAVEILPDGGLIGVSDPRGSGRPAGR